MYYEAAHSAGRTLALWNTEGKVGLRRDRHGRPQDFPLVSREVSVRVNRAADELGIQVVRAARCNNCT